MFKSQIILILLLSINSAHALKKKYIISFKKNKAFLNKKISGASTKAIKRFKRSEIAYQVGESIDGQVIENIEIDRVLNISRSANDTYYNSQWALQNSPGSIDINSAWNETIGDSSIVVAVVDTGILQHTDIQNKLLPGYDFVSDVEMAVDGNGRDNDPTDPGDHISYSDTCYSGRTQQSSWHGTHVAGIVAASSNNNQGVTGVSWNAKVLPVRVLGKCGGYTSDIADGVKWAAGVSVAGVPTNTNPAKVINLSLGGVGACSSYMQDAINQARSRGAVVIVAAGNNNSSLDYSSYTPANCAGVVVVGSNDQYGSRSGFSNYGKAIDVSAPGSGILSLGNSGTTTANTDSYVYYDGTSMAAPHVAGVASLILSVNPDLYPDQVEYILQESSTSFSSYSDCDQLGCGAGILNATEALYLASTVTPDASYSELDTVPGGGTSENQILESNFDAGMCGSIDIQDGGSSGNGPLSLTLFGLMFLVFGKLKKELMATI